MPIESEPKPLAPRGQNFPSMFDALRNQQDRVFSEYRKRCISYRTLPGKLHTFDEP